MPDISSEFVTLVVSLPIGYASKVLQDRQARRRAQRERDRERWDENRQRYYLPLIGASRDVGRRLRRLSVVYQQEPGEIFEPDSLSADFRELYRLDRGPIPNLYVADPNGPRSDVHRVQVLRTRMCRELNFATSSLYLTARYIALAELTRRHLDGAQHGLPPATAASLREQIEAVSLALQGPTGAGIAVEQQESIGEMMFAAHGEVITQFEFRKRLLELPGWEQFTMLLTFYLTQDGGGNSELSFGAKVEHEVRTTIAQLAELEHRLDALQHQMTA
jgi:hypothetical protein